MAQPMKRPLWWQLVTMFRKQISQQWLLIALRATSEFATRLILFRLLRCLEAPTDNRLHHSFPSRAMLWVAGLAASLLVESFASQWLNWISQMKLSMPVIALLNGLVFEKMTRLPKQGKVPRDEDGETLDASAPTNISLGDLLSNHK